MSIEGRLFYALKANKPEGDKQHQLNNKRYQYISTQSVHGQRSSKNKVWAFLPLLQCKRYTRQILMNCLTECPEKNMIFKEKMRRIWGLTPFNSLSSP